MTARFAGRWSFKERRFVSFFLIYASTFIQGVEIAVVLPTAWKYLQTLGVYDETFLGFLISTYSVTAVIAGLLVGHWVDRSENTRKVLLYVNVCQIVGNLMYFIGLHPGMLIAARFLCGFGSGIGSACFSDLSRASKVSERTKILTVAFAMRQVGILVGPMYTLALHHVDIHIGPLRINEESAPGLVMAGYWIIFQILIFFLYSNIGQEYHRQGIRVKKTRRLDLSGSYGSMRSGEFTDGEREDFEDTTTIHHMLRSDNHSRPQTKFTVQDNNNESDCQTNEVAWMTWSQQLRTKQQNQQSQGASSGEPPSANASFVSEETSGLLACPGDGSETSHGRSPTLLESFSAARRTYLDVFLDDRLIPLLFLQTIAYFILTVVQTIIPPAVEHYFGYGTKVTSVIFMVAGAEGLLIYLAMLFLQRVQDRVLVVVGYFMLLISVGVTGYVSYLLSSGSGIDANSTAAAELFWPLVGGFGIIFISVPMLSAAAVALMSKVVDRSAQGMAQGLRRTSLFLGVVFGPLWGGAMIYNPLYLYGMSAVLLIIAGVLFALSFRKLFVCHETADLHQNGSSPSSYGRSEPDEESSRASSV